VRNFGSSKMPALTWNINQATRPDRTGGCIVISITVYWETKKAIFHCPQILRRSGTGICLCSIIVYFGLLFSAAGAELARSKMYDIEAKWPVGRHELAEMVRRDTMSDSTVSCSN